MTRLAPVRAVLLSLLPLAAPAAHAFVEVGADDFRITTTGPEGDVAYTARSPALAHDPEHDRYLLCWASNSDDVAFTEISCKLLDAEGVEIPTQGGGIVSRSGSEPFSAFGPTVAFTPAGPGFLVCWEGESDADGQVLGEYEIFCRLLDELGQIDDDPVRISEQGGLGDSLEDAGSPVVAWDSTNEQFVVCWEGDQIVPGEFADNELEIYCRATDGSTAYGSAVRLSDMGPAENASYDATAPALTPGVAPSEMAIFLVCWQGSDDAGSLALGELEIYCRRLDAATLTPIESQIRVSHAGADGNASVDALRPSIGFDPELGSFAGCWEVTGGRIDCARWSNELEIEVAEAPITGLAPTPASARFGLPKLVHAGERWVACFYSNFHDDSGPEIRCQLLDPDLVPLGPTAGAISSIGNGPLAFNNLFAPAIAWNPNAGEWLAVWPVDDLDADLEPGEVELFGQRVDLHSIFLDGFEVDGTARWSAVAP